MSESYVVKVKSHESSIWRRHQPRLGSLDIELTERCNNDCIHCCINLPANDVKARAREMTTDQVKAILKEAAHLGPDHPVDDQTAKLFHVL